jgi:hypothetical protein
VASSALSITIGFAEGFNDVQNDEIHLIFRLHHTQGEVYVKVEKCQRLISLYFMHRKPVSCAQLILRAHCWCKLGRTDKYLQHYQLSS